MGIKSTFRSKMMSTGRDEGVPDAVEGLFDGAENRLSFEFKIWSRSFRSSLAAIISAAAPFGQRIMGITARESQQWLQSQVFPNISYP